MKTRNYLAVHAHFKKAGRMKSRNQRRPQNDFRKDDGCMDYSTLTLAELSDIIIHDWISVNCAAVPYLSAMGTLSTMSDSFGADDAQTIVLYFLSNASNWRGTLAREIKTELKKRLNKK